MIPGEFDYAAYLFRQQIRRNSRNLSRVLGNGQARNRHEMNSGRCMEEKYWIIIGMGFSGDEFAVFVRFDCWYKEELSEDLRETYQVAGVSHILALSGMHIAGFVGDYCVGYCVRWIEVVCCDG